MHFHFKALLANLVSLFIFFITNIIQQTLNSLYHNKVYLVDDFPPKPRMAMTYPNQPRNFFCQKIAFYAPISSEPYHDIDANIWKKSKIYDNIGWSCLKESFLNPFSDPFFSCQKKPQTWCWEMHFRGLNVQHGWHLFSVQSSCFIWMQKKLGTSPKFISTYVYSNIAKIKHLEWKWKSLFADYCKIDEEKSNTHVTIKDALKWK